MIYGGVGSRKAAQNQHVMWLQTKLAKWLANRDWLLRSGGAKGSDLAYEIGCDEVKGKKEIYYADDCKWRGVEEPPELNWELALEVASRLHPAWDRCDQYVRALHARNGFIVMGGDFQTPIDLLVCWTPSGKIEGGTGQAMRLCQEMDIPIFNIAHYHTAEELVSELKTLVNKLEVEKAE